MRTEKADKEEDMTLMEFSLMPLDKGISLSKYVARALTIIEESGMAYRLNAMGTVVEGEWDDLVGLLTRCFRDLEKDSDRISLQVKFDHRKGVSGAINAKIRSVQARAGRQFKIED
jgi:uncharacterized protein (TIGR00106 family)